MQIYPGLPPYTDTQGRGKIRIGKDCQPLTGTLRRRVMVETGETDFTATPVSGRIKSLLSAAAMERPARWLVVRMPLTIFCVGLTETSFPHWGSFGTDAC